MKNSAFIFIVILVTASFGIAQKTRKPLSAEDYFRRGVEKASVSCQEAVKDLDKAIRLNPRKAEYFKTRSDCLKTLPLDFNYEKTLADLNKAIELKPDYLEAYLSRVKIYSAYFSSAYLFSDDTKDHYALAKADYDKIIELEPENEQSYIRRAAFLMDGGNFHFKEALNDLAKAIELNPSSDDAYESRINFYLTYGDYKKAITDATTLIKTSSKSGSGFVERGEIYVELGKYEEAIADFNEALKRELSWGPIQALEGRAAAYRAVGKIALAEADESEVEKLLPGRAKVRLRLAGNPPKPLTDAELTDSYLGTSRKNELFTDDEGVNRIQIKRLTAILEAEPQSSAAFLDRGRTYSRLKEYEKAIADFSEAVKLDPQDFRAFNSRGVVYARAGNYERAVADFTQAMSINPNQPVSLYNFALVSLDKGLSDQSVKMFSLYLTKEPNNVNAYRLRAKAYRQLGKTAEAEADEKTVKKLEQNK